MQLALTTEEAAFRDELRGIYTTQIPAELRELMRHARPFSPALLRHRTRRRRGRNKNLATSPTTRGDFA